MKDLSKIERENHIYRTTNIETGEFYIGCSTWNWDRALRPSHQRPEYLGSFTYQPWSEMEIEEQRRVLRKDILMYGMSQGDTFDLEARLIDKAFDNPLNVNVSNPATGFYSNTAGTVTAAPIDDPTNFKQVLKEEFHSNRDQYLTTAEGKKRPDVSKILAGRTGDKNPMYGRFGADSPVSKKVIHIESGEVFNSQIEAAEAFNLSTRSIYRHCHNKVKNPKFKFKEDSNE